MNPQLKILLIEDNPGDADLVRENFPQDGSTSIKWVTRMSDALSHLRENGTTDMALLDLGLPDSNGVDCVRAIREAVPCLPVVVITCNDDENTIIAALHEGAQDYLNKSEITPNLMLRTVKYAIERKKATLDLSESETRFKEMFEHTINGEVVFQAIDDGANFIVVDFNKSAEKIEKISRADALGKKVTDAFPGVKACGHLEVLQKVWSTGIPEHSQPFYYEDHRIVGWRDNYVYKLPSGDIVAIYSDETQRIQAEQELKESEEQYRIAIEYSNDGVSILKGFDHLYVNQKYLKITRYSCNILNRTQVISLKPDWKF